MALPDPEGLTPTQLREHHLAMRLVIPLVVLLAAVLAVFYVFYDSSRVSGDSMLPTLRSGEYLLITRGSSHPVRGEVCVVIWTHGGVGEEIVKRVVAVGGDTVTVNGDFVLVNGKPEAFAHDVIATSESFSGTVKVPRGSVYVLGDNRAVSLDSRVFGPLPLSAVHGRVVAVWAPITRMRVVPSP